MQADAINHLGAEYLARAAEKHNAVLIHVSTDYIFDGSSDIAYVEADQTNPQSVYGKNQTCWRTACYKAVQETYYFTHCLGICRALQ